MTPLQAPQIPLFNTNVTLTSSTRIMAAVHGFDMFVGELLSSSHSAWGARVYLHLQAAKALRLRMDKAIEEASAWTADVGWEQGEAPQHWLGRGFQILQWAKSEAKDLVSLVQVKSTLHVCAGPPLFVAYRLASDAVLLHEPDWWLAWGRLFLDAYFAASSHPTNEQALRFMNKWKVVYTQLLTFYDENKEPRRGLPSVLQEVNDGSGYFGESGRHWILDV